jgi:hypothetical protein
MYSTYGFKKVFSFVKLFNLLITLPILYLYLHALPHRQNWKLSRLPPLDILVIHFLLSETNFSSLPLWTTEISSVGVDLFWNDSHQNC